MPVNNAVAPSKRKKANKIITDLSKVTQDDDESDPEASEFDLGTKIKTPKDVMLEELSLLNNRGSKMFRMRQQRVERFIITDQNMQNLENFLMCPPTPPPKPDMSKPPEPEVVQEVDPEALKQERRKKYVRTYVSPWERAMKGNEELTATMRPNMPGPIHCHPDLPLYKSFNRTALPFGGFGKASELSTFVIPELGMPAEEPEPQLPSLQPDLRSRPSFNRTPIGWVFSGDENATFTMELDNGETEDL